MVVVVVVAGVVVVVVVVAIVAAGVVVVVAVVAIVTARGLLRRKNPLKGRSLREPEISRAPKGSTVGRTIIFEHES